MQLGGGLHFELVDVAGLVMVIVDGCYSIIVDVAPTLFS